MSKLFWSEELTKLTKETLEDLYSGMYKGQKCNLKRRNGKNLLFGYITNTPDLMFRNDYDEIKINETEGSEIWAYKSIDEIIEDGWAVD